MACESIRKFWVAWRGTASLAPGINILPLRKNTLSAVGGHARGGSAEECLGEPGLPFNRRVYSFASPGDVTKHFRRKHLANYKKGGRLECKACQISLNHDMQRSETQTYETSTSTIYRRSAHTPWFTLMSLDVTTGLGSSIFGSGEESRSLEVEYHDAPLGIPEHVGLTLVAVDHSLAAHIL